MKKTVIICFLSCVLLGLTSIQTTAQSQAFSIDTIGSEVMARMVGQSYPAGCTMPVDDLRYLRLLHYDADGRVHQGELVCSKLIAADLLDIFSQLYKARYPIERMVLVDNYGADDERSMTANNTSCFCYRPIAGSKRLSKHSQGLAIDINPLYNPCVRKRSNGTTTVSPRAGRPYANRKHRGKYKLEKGDLCYRLFIEHGFTWGGNWRSVKDYQHFEK